MKLLAILDGEQRAYDRANAVKMKNAGNALGPSYRSLIRIF